MSVSYLTVTFIGEHILDGMRERERERERERAISVNTNETRYSKIKYCSFIVISSKVKYCSFIVISL